MTMTTDPSLGRNDRASRASVALHWVLGLVATVLLVTPVAAEPPWADSIQLSGPERTLRFDRAFAVAAGDLDGDGDEDVVAAGRGSAQTNVLVYRNDASDPPSLPRIALGLNGLDRNWYSVDVADMNQDGFADIVLVGTNAQFNRAVAILPGTGGPLDTDSTTPLPFAPLVDILPGPGTIGFDIAVRDMDGDGWLDIVVLDGAAQVRVFRNVMTPTSNAFTSTGSFQQIASISGGSFNLPDEAARIGRVAVGDLDGDSILDIVWTDPLQDTIGWIRQSPVGTYQQQPAISTSTDGRADGVEGIALADFDGDLDLDVAHASRNDDTVSWWANSGDASAFTENVLTERDAVNDEEGPVDGSLRVVARDVDGDGDGDLAVVSYDNDGVFWFENRLDETTDPGFPARTITVDPDGTFRRETCTNDLPCLLYPMDDPSQGPRNVINDDPCCTIRPYSSVVAFVNGDDEPDRVQELLGTSEGTIDGPRGLALGDFDGDGDVDVVTASERDDTIALHQNLSCDAFGFPVQPDVLASFPDVFGITATRVADADGDGDLDIFAANSLDSEVIYFRNGGGVLPSFSGPFIVADLPSSAGGSVVETIEVADIDGDGDQDVAVVVRNRAQLLIFLNQGGTSGFRPLPSAVTERAFGIRDVAIADMDDDGDLDLVTASTVEGRATLWLNDGGSPPEFDGVDVVVEFAGMYDVAVGDIDGDGRLDIAAAAFLLPPDPENTEPELRPTIGWGRNLGTDPPTFEPYLIARSALVPPGGEPPESGAIGGPTASGDLSGATSDLRRFFSGSTPDGPARMPMPLAAGDVYGGAELEIVDLDGDGDRDVLVAGIYNDKLAWYENSGASDPEDIFPQPDQPSQLIETERLISEDPDGFSLVTPSVTTGPPNPAPYQDVPQIVTLRYSDPSNPLRGALDGPVALDVLDFDGDGDRDILVGSIFGQSVDLYENDGRDNPRFVRRTVTGSAVTVRGVAAGDLNGDGRVDVVSGAHGDFRNPTADQVGWFLNGPLDDCVRFDLNGDGYIDGHELTRLAWNFGASGAGDDRSPLPEGDFSGDDRVDGEDLSVLGSTGIWGKTIFQCASTCQTGDPATPE